MNLTPFVKIKIDKMSKEHDIRYSDKVNCTFSEALYQKMASERFGITFCCNDDLEKRMIDKELLDLNALKDCDLESIIPSTLPEPLPLFQYCISCTNLEAGLDIPNINFFELSAMVTNGEYAYVLDDFLFSLGATQSERDFLFSLVENLWGDQITQVVLETALIQLAANTSEPYASDLRMLTDNILQCLIYCKNLVVNPNTCLSKIK